MLNFRAVIEVAERLVVIAAAVVAVFPLYQWYSEKEERRLERVTSFISAGSECLNYTDVQENVALLRIASQPNDFSITNTTYTRLNLAKMCAEVYKSLLSEYFADDNYDIYEQRNAPTDEYFETLWKYSTRRDLGNFVVSEAQKNNHVTIEDYEKWVLDYHGMERR